MVEWSLWATVLAGALGAVIVIGAPHLERSLLYHPTPGKISPSVLGLEIEDVALQTADGETLVVWYRAATAPGAPTLLYAHGNAGHLADRAERLQRFMDKGTGVAIFAYRGYSGSTGRPSEAANVADAIAVYDWLTNAQAVPAERLALYGESLGSGVVMQLAAKRAAAAIILDAPFTSLAEVGQRHYPYLPAKLMMRDRYDNMRVAGQSQAPILIIHGECDAIVPVSMGRALARACGARAQIVTFPLAGHSDHAFDGSMTHVDAFLDSVFGRGTGGIAPEVPSHTSSAHAVPPKAAS